MKRRAASISVLVLFFLVGKGVPPTQASGGEKEARQVSSVVKGWRAPGRPNTPWAPPDLRTFAEPLREEHPAEIDPQKEYELAELIDLAEQVNPETKVAWSRAKVAAAGVGLAQSEYYPVLAL